MQQFGVALRVLLVIGVGLWLAIRLRYQLLESDALARQCLQAGAELACQVRSGLPQLFLQDRLGWACLLAGLGGFFGAYRSLAWLGLFLGCIGLVLYSFDLAAVGGLLSLLTLFRPLPARP
ncbi:MAG: hypothetical protein RIR00_1891 [Pseudomonadota bacterium]|jgi:hypothetical protein